MSASLEQALQAHFGFGSFRAHQREVIEQVLAGRPTLAVMPTGSGKSLCYQLPAVLLPGLTLVVSPLIALMKDQVDALVARGIPATFVNSTLSERERRDRTAAATAGGYKLLYVAPERFRSPRFVEALARAPIDLFAVDEAHCISAWGHDFRPDYARLGEFRARVRAPRTLALTATATPEVRRDVCRALRLQAPAVVVAGFDRPNIALEVRRVRGEREKAACAGALAAQGGSGIVYTATRRGAERMTGHLAAQGVPALCYHAGLSDAERRAAQEGFMASRRAVVVATNAFGMGVDKADLRFVVHAEIPRSVEAYYQEIGRAGRDGAPAQALLLFNHADVHMQERLIQAAHPAPAVVADVWDLLRAERGADIGPRRLAERLGVREAQVQAALRLLEQAGHLERSSSEPVAQVALARPEREIRLPDRAPAQRAALIALASALSGGPGPREVQLDEVAARAGMSGESFRRALAALEEAGVVRCQPVTSAMRVLDPTLPPELLRVDGEEVAARSRRERTLLQAMTRYAYARTCRRRFLLGYFGDSPPPGCQSCDNCQGRRTPEPGRADAARPRRAPRVSATLRATCELFQGGLRVEDIARVRGLSAQTILRHLAELAAGGEALDLSRVVGAERAALILEAARGGPPFLSSIKGALPPDFLYEEIRLVLAACGTRPRSGEEGACPDFGQAIPVETTPAGGSR